MITEYNYIENRSCNNKIYIFKVSNWAIVLNQYFILIITVSTLFIAENMKK